MTRSGLLLCCFAATLPASAATAATFTVNVGNDVDDTVCSTTHCSLREAINAANASLGADTIDFSASITRVDLTSGLPWVRESVSIGSAYSAITVDAHGTGRVFRFDGTAPGQSFSLDFVIVQGGYESAGGGIYVGPTDSLTLDFCTVHDNVAMLGGGIYLHSASLTMNLGSLYFNSSLATYTNGGGGGLMLTAGASATLNNVSISGNTAEVYGGGVFNLYGDLTLNGSTVEQNSAHFGGGSGVWGGGGGVASIQTATSGSLNLNNSWIHSNYADGTQGVGLYAAKLGGSRPFAVTDSTIEFNLGVGSLGGGVYVGAGRLVVTRSSLYVNNVDLGSGLGMGGGLYLGHFQSDTSKNGAVALTNVTISSNTASVGGGISGDSTAPSAMVNTTVATNLTSSGAAVHLGAPLVVFPGTSLHSFRNNLIANPGSAGDCAVPFAYSVATGYNDHNLARDYSCAFGMPGDRQGVDPKLAAPLDKSPASSVATQALLFGSPAIDAGVAATTTDARGAAAVGPRDIGSYEYGGFGIFGFTTSAMVVVEGSGASPLVTRGGGGTASAVTIQGVMTPGSATPPADYTGPSPASLSWPASVTSPQPWPVILINPDGVFGDDVTEPAESFTLQLDPGNGDLGAHSSLMITIAAN